MSIAENPFQAVDDFVEKFGLADSEPTIDVIDYRMDLLKEEYQETDGAYRVCDVEQLIDGHIDIIVVAMGNLAIFGVDGRKAFARVMEANMAKVKGKRRETDVEGQSLIKPEGWIGPNHKDNHGKLE